MIVALDPDFFFRWFGPAISWNICSMAFDENVHVQTVTWKRWAYPEQYPTEDLKNHYLHVLRFLCGFVWKRGTTVFQWFITTYHDFLINIAVVVYHIFAQCKQSKHLQLFDMGVVPLLAAGTWRWDGSTPVNKTYFEAWTSADTSHQDVHWDTFRFWSTVKKTWYCHIPLGFCSFAHENQ